jgi:hypothetical protein
MIAALASVPWGTIIDAAPSVIEGASKLLRQIGLTKSKIPATDTLALVNLGKIDAGELSKTVAALEASLSGLNAQMSTATSLIAELAEANRLLAARVYAHRLWLRVLAAMGLLTICLSIYAAIKR